MVSEMLKYLLKPDPMEDILNEIQLLRQSQKELTMQLESLQEAEVRRESHKGTWKYVAGGVVCLAVICGAIYLSNVDIKGCMSILGDAIKDMNIETVSRAGKFESSLSVENGKRQEVLIEALTKIEDRLSTLIQRVLTQNARSSGPSFSSNDFFSSLPNTGRRLGD